MVSKAHITGIILYLGGFLRELAKTKDPDIPVVWNCCDEPVAPKDLAQHYKDNHLHDGRGPTMEESAELVFVFSFIVSVILVHGLTNPA